MKITIASSVKPKTQTAIEVDNEIFIDNLLASYRAEVTHQKDICADLGNNNDYQKMIKLIKRLTYLQTMNLNY